MQVHLRSVWTAAVLAALLVAAGSLALAVEVEVLSTEKDAAPGSFVTHVFAVTNPGPAPATCSLAWDVPSGWGALGIANTLAVAADGEELLFVTLTVPAGAPAGEYAVRVVLTSPGDPPSVVSAVAVVVVMPVQGIEVLPPQGGAVAPGGRVEYGFIVYNRGNMQDSVSIEAGSSRRLTVDVSPDRLDLAPQERATVRVLLSVPPDAPPGRDVLTVTATSTLRPGVEADGIVFTSILPPGPELVRGSLMETLPGRLRIAVERDVFGGGFQSHLTFSTSTQILGGTFSVACSVENPFGPLPVELASFAIRYGHPPITYAVGKLTERLTELVRLSCLGGSIVVDERLFDLAIVAGGSGDETRFAGRVAFGPEELSVGVACLDIRDPTPARSSIWSATASAEPLPGCTLLIEGGLGVDAGHVDRAALLSVRIDARRFFFHGSAFSVGTFFPGARQDSAGVELSYRLRMDAFSLSASLAHVWDNVACDPALPTRIRDSLGVNVTARPLEDGPAVTATVEFSWDRQRDLGLESEADALLALGVTQTEGVFPYVLSGKMADRIDRVIGSHVRRCTFTQGAGLSVDSLFLFLELVQEKQIDLATDLVLSSSSEAILRFRPAGERHEASIAFSSRLDVLDLSASWIVSFARGLDLVFDGAIEWDRADVEVPTFTWGITLAADMEIPAPFFMTKGSIEGRAFLDWDGDGAFGPLDRPLGGIVLAADGVEVSTDGEGRFRFSPLPPATYVVAAQRLPTDVTAGEAVSVELRAGQRLWVEIAVTPVLQVGGAVFDDADQDGALSPGDGGFAEVRVLLSDETGVVTDAYTDAIGAFQLLDVPPGRYAVRLDTSTLPPRFVFTTAEEVWIEVTSEAPPPVLFGGYIKPREILITFQPPTADFEYTPMAPLAGESVLFDGRPSFDFDGEIVSYAWDFDADGALDAEGEVVEWSFPEAGRYDVSLTVTDDGGNADTLTQTVEVGGRSEPPSSGTPAAAFHWTPSEPVAGEPVLFNGTASLDADGRIVGFRWDFDGDDVPDSDAPLAEHTFESPGSYLVSLIVIDGDGNIDRTSKAIVVAPPRSAPPGDPKSFQPPIADFAYLPVAPRAGDSVLFNGTLSTDFDGAIVSYAWDFDADGVEDAAGPTVERTFSAPGAYPVSLTVTDDGGNRDTLTLTVEVGPGGE